MNCKPIDGQLLECGMHTLTKDSHEVTMGLTVAMIVPACNIIMQK